MKTLLLVLTLLLASCSPDNPPKKYFLVIPQKNKTVTEVLDVGRRFNQDELIMATNAFKFVKSLINDTSLEPDFSRFYWTPMDCCYGLTVMGGPEEKRFVMICPEIYPTNNTLDAIFCFGLVLVHETAHFKHNLREREVEFLVDIRAATQYKIVTKLIFDSLTSSQSITNK